MPTQIVLYEDPLNHNGEGGHVVRLDGSVVFLNGPQFTAAIESLTLPDGTPWQPHELVDERDASDPVPMSDEEEATSGD